LAIRYYEKGAEQVTMSHLNKIKALITENIEKVEGAESEQINRSFQNTLAHIEYKIAHAVDGERSFKGFE
jgi:predicted metal-dependent peptidase